jgi:hypothetical protein
VNLPVNSPKYAGSHDLKQMQEFMKKKASSEQSWLRDFAFHKAPLTTMLEGDLR